MRFHVDSEPAENLKQVLGGPWTWETTDAEEFDSGIRVECTCLEGEFVGRKIGHFLSASEKSKPFLVQFLVALGYPGADSGGELDINEQDLIGYKFSAKARKQKRKGEEPSDMYSELHYFEALSEAEANSLRP